MVFVVLWWMCSVWLELLLLGSAGIAPVLWMQWRRPFYIFSFWSPLPKPEQLTSVQQRLLRLFKGSNACPWTVIAAVVSKDVPLAALSDCPHCYRSVTTTVPFTRALTAWQLPFSPANLFFQVPLSALRVLLTSNAKIEAAEPYPMTQIKQDFTVLGLQVQQILPPLEETSSS